MPIVLKRDMFFVEQNHDGSRVHLTSSGNVSPITERKLNDAEIGSILREANLPDTLSALLPLSNITDKTTGSIAVVAFIAYSITRHAIVKAGPGGYISFLLTDLDGKQPDGRLLCPQ